MIKKYKYKIVLSWSEEDKGFGVEVPELNGCFSFGKTETEALRNAKDAIATWIDVAKDADIEVPEPLAVRKFSGKFNLRIEPETHRSLAFNAKKHKMSLNNYVGELLHKALA